MGAGYSSQLITGYLCQDEHLRQMPHLLNSWASLKISAFLERSQNYLLNQDTTVIFHALTLKWKCCLEHNKRELWPLNLNLSWPVKYLAEIGRFVWLSSISCSQSSDHKHEGPYYGLNHIVCQHNLQVALWEHCLNKLIK